MMRRLHVCGVVAAAVALVTAALQAVDVNRALAEAEGRRRAAEERGQGDQGQVVGRH